MEKKNLEQPYKITRAHRVPKGWGRLMSWQEGEEVRIGEIWAYQQDLGEDRDLVKKVETVKILYFGQDKRLSLHFHAKKEEIFVCAMGQIDIEVISPNGDRMYDTLMTGDRCFIPKNTPHRMWGRARNNILVEISTLHEDSDSYRIERGD